MKKTIFKKKAVSIIGLMFVFIMSFALLNDTSTHFEKIMKGVTGLFAKNTDGSPLHEKILTDNEDGTYKLSLNVTGESEKKVTKANVIVVFDTSSSMNSYTNTAGYAISNRNDNNMYGLVNGEYVRIYRHSEGYGWNTSYYYTLTDSTNGERYTGARYVYSNNVTRLAAAESAVINLGKSLLAKNTEENPDVIEIALVDFANIAEIAQEPTTNFNDLVNVVSSRNAGNNNRGTNWEAALQKVLDVDFNDKDKTYVIFVSDGNPTFRNTSGGYSDLDYDYDYNRQYGIYGTGNDENSTTVARCYEQSTDDAKAIVDKGYEFYTIGVYGNVTRMQNLTTASGTSLSNYYSASNTAALQSALNEILEKIETAGFGEISINDGTTKSVTASSGSMNGGILDIDETSYKYYLSTNVTANNDGSYSFDKYTVTQAGNTITISWKDKEENTKTATYTGSITGDKLEIEWDKETDFYKEAPKGQLVNGEVKWDLSSLGILLDGVTYTITFDVWPSQVTLDLIADLKNGTIKYDDLDDSVTAYLVRSGNNYLLKTNTKATLSYNDTRTEDGKKTAEYDNPDPVSTATSELLSVAKKWENYLDGRKAEGIELKVNRDKEERYQVKLNADNEYKNNVFISIGIMTVKNGEVSLKTTGHDYAFSESNNIAYNWELEADTVHPMLINNKLTMLIKLNSAPDGMTGSYYNDGTNTYYKIGENYYKEDKATTPSLTAKNVRRSYLNVTKEVTGADAKEESLFTYTMKVNSADNKDVWFSIWDGQGSVTNTDEIAYVTGATAELNDDGSLTGYYYATSGSEITIKLRAGWNLRFTNLPVGSTYNITESSEMEDGYVFRNVSGTRTTYFEKDSENSETGTVRGSNITGTIEYNNTDYTITYKNEYVLTHVNVSKVWSDNDNQDGKRPESVTVSLLANNESTGTTFVLNGNNQWTATFEDLKVYDNDGREIKYTVEEVTTNVITGTDGAGTYSYEITGSQKDGYTITNTHTPEKIEVSGTKVWSDADNQDGKRPASIVVILKADGTEVARKEVTEADKWSYTFSGLEKYKEGQEIVYTVDEVEVSGYTKQIDGYNIINTHTPEKTEVTVNKVWNDNNNQDGKRPGNIKVKLFANNESASDEIELNASNDWTHVFREIPKYKGGQEIVYTVDEVNVPEGYTKEITKDEETGTITITNTHEKELTSITVQKVWNDANNQDGKRPASIVVILKADGTEVARKEVTEADKWSYTFSDLEKYKEGQEIVYTVDEVEVSGYTKEIDGYTITNTHTPEKTEVTVNKVWNDDNNQDGKRPASITVNLLANGEKVQEAEVRASNDGSWTYTFSSLDKYKGGQEIVYTITENPVDDYETKVDGYTITNTHEKELTSVTGTKVWSDADNQDGKRPASIVVILKADGTEVARKEVTEADKWSYTFPDLEKYKEGQEIVYTVDEVEVSGYTKEIDGYNITNTHTPEETEVTVTKNWVDNNNQDGIRPGNIKVKLFANNESASDEIELNASNDWTHVFREIPKYKGGQEIVYTVDEVNVPDGYTKEITKDEETGTIIITNTHEKELTSITVQKVWNDKNNQDGIRPSEVKIQLYANGNPYDKEITLNEANNWKHVYTDLDKKESGKDIVYSVTENKVEGYQTNISSNIPGVITITNTHEPELTKVSVQKVWNDNDDQDRVRPDKITVELLSNGESTNKFAILSAEGNWYATFEGLDKNKDGEEITYSIKEQEVSGYTPSISGVLDGQITLTNTHKVEKTELEVTKVWSDADNQDGKRPASITVELLSNGEKTGKTIILDESNKWTSKFSDLDKNKNGVEIEYSISEVEVASYEVSMSSIVDGKITLTNTHIPSTVNLTVEKVWVDNNDQDGIRPESVTVRLFGNDEEIQVVELSESEDKGWTYTFENLPQYKNGKEINYSVKEDAVDGYESKIDGFTIINTHNPSKIRINGTKTWDDDNNRDNKRPFSIVVTLNRSVGEEVLDPITKQVTENDNWSYDFGELDEYKDGVQIVYTITENAVEGYKTVVKNYDITNIHEIETFDISGTKTWDDNNNQDGVRPESISVILKADGEEIDKVEISEDSDWTYKFSDLEKYREGKIGEEIVYTVEEVDVDLYVTEINDYEIINHHIPETLTFTVTKNWEDYDNNDGIRPENITVRLYGNGKEIKTQEINADNEWTYTFEDLPRYDNGKEIEYSIKEDEVKGYVTTVSENIEIIDDNETKVINAIITNTHEKEKTEIVGEKIWEDFDNKFDSRPDEITIYLYKKDELYKTIVVSSESDWKYVIDNLDKYSNGEEITYTLKEETVEGYETTYDEYNIVNTIIWNVGDGNEELPPQTGFEIEFNNVLYVIISGVLFILGTYFKHEEVK